MHAGPTDVVPFAAGTDWTKILFEVMDAVVLVHDLHGNIVEANAAAGRRLGYTHAELLRLNSRDLVIEAEVELARRLHFLEENPTARFEGRLRTRDGHILVVDVGAFVVPLRGKPAVLAVAHDITQHRATEKALRDSEALYHSLVESLPQYILRKDLHGRFTFGNQGYCSQHGMTLAELRGKTDFDLFPADLAAKYVRDDQAVVHSGRVFEAVEEHRLPDGTQIFVQVVKTPVRDAQGHIIGIQGIFWDVTDQRRAALALADSERRYRELAEATLDGIVVVDQAELVRLFNPAAEHMFGYRAEEVLGQSVTLLIPERMRDHRHGFQRLLEAGDEGRGRTMEMQARRKDGSEFPVEVALSVLSVGGQAGPDGREPSHVLGALRDLTERNKIRSMLIQNEKLASIGMLSAGVAHEINNPLAFVANNIAVLERDCKGLLDVVSLFEDLRPHMAEKHPDESAMIQAVAERIDLPYVRENLLRILDRTREGVDRVTRIVHSLRGLARTDPPQRQEANLADLVANSLEIVRSRLKQNVIEVEQEHDPQPMVFGVITQLSQVILNLLVNAVQAIEAFRKQEGRIAIRTCRFPGEMLLEVADNGGGIAPEALPRLFDPFFTTKDVGEGTGLGLSITHNIVSAHGGRIEVDSKPGKGATFRIYLPLRSRPRGDG